jgi:hypothetical protein
MPRQPIRTLLLMSAAVIATGIAAASPPHTLLHARRQAESDLEVTGLIKGLPQGGSAYVGYKDLLALPQVAATITDDPDYPGPPLHVSGVLFETLAAAVGALPESDLIDALCADRYRSHFPAGYIAQHHPILVLTIEHKPLAEWAMQAHQYDPSPYVVMYPHFVPAFKVLAHADQPQLPDNLIRLNFTTQARTFGPITPRGNFAADSPEQQGFTIAKQNCLRCHFQGSSGGTKSGRTWQSLSVWAAEQPKFFQAYVKDPTKFERHSHMAANPEYDAATLAVLTAYFRTFSETAKAETR